jgi:hypothetical protein
MFPVMNKLEIKRAKEKLKKPHFRGGGGFHAVLETYYVYKYNKFFKFVKILNHFQVQVLLNLKNRSFLRLLWAEIFLRQFSKF